MHGPCCLRHVLTEGWAAVERGFDARDAAERNGWLMFARDVHVLALKVIRGQLVKVILKA